MLPWILAGILAALITVLAVRLRAIQKSMDEIVSGLARHLSSDTNQLISISSNDKHVRRLAGEIARQLAELRRRRHQYVNGDRELKEAITNISHDLRTPLTAICGYLDLLETEEKTENTKRYVEQIANRTEALKALTEELFRYSILSSDTELHKKRVNVSHLLEDAVLSFYGAFEGRGIRPQITMPEKSVWKTLDPAALSRIFENIIGNAVKYSSGDFAVTLTEEGHMTFSNAAPALSSVDVGKLFDRFYTVDSARKSTGLGLSIAKLLTERMNGQIGAVYRNGSLTVTLTFP